MGSEEEPAGREASVPPGETESKAELRLPATGEPERPRRRVVPGGPPRTRTSSAFVGVVAGVIVLVLLLIFIIENTSDVEISYFGANGHLPLGVALLLAAVGGALLVAVIGAARIAQLRRHAKRRTDDHGRLRR